MNVDPTPIEKSKLAYSLEEAAGATGYSTSTLRIAIRRHDLIARYANTKPVILAEELLNWLRSLPTEPRGGLQPLSDFPDDNPRPFPGPPRELAATPQVKALFRTPEEVAPEVGVSKSTLRGYCRASGIYSRVGKRIMLHEDDVRRLVEWIREYRDKGDEWVAEPEADPFA
ncbi:helix-turn-helix domain-containing protein [Arthrobacter pascens]|uniref:helix-turn-helix domain-containing protein n=1 Tax=Arthrobacter pascens TaxID=1677 RepID=UPI0027D7C81B|nr:helix-turn-helix domain-containing protein [Arthrobacter pascens]